MATQNMYNNYIKRQQKNPMNNFRQKVTNSLTGRTVGNNTTTNKTSPQVLGQAKSTLGATTQPKPNTSTNQTRLNDSINQAKATMSTMAVTEPTPQAITSQIKPTTMGEGMFVGDMPVNASEANIQAQNTMPGTTNGVTNGSTNGTTNGATNGTGMMSLSDINNAIQGGEGSGTEQLTPEDAAQINELSRTPEVISMARAKKKTPQELAQDLVTTQKDQLKEEWKQQIAELELQKTQLQESYNQSVKDAENAYKDTEKTLQENRYTQQENLAVSGQRRGIQYSPQQLALENVANINLNKNLAEASNKRNELLNQLAIQLGQSMANVTMGLQNANVQYNTNVSNLMAEYQKQLMDWAYNDQQTESDRKWQEEQTKADQAFQKEMAELQNKWQAEQNALDRKQYGKSSGGSGGYSYSRSYTPYSSYKGGARSASGNWGNYSMNDLDLTTDEGKEAFGNTVEQYSTDLYNALDYGSMYDVNDKGKIYSDEVDNLIQYAKNNGADKETINELEQTRKTALKHLYNKSYARSTRSDIKVGDTIYRGNDIGLPVRESYIKDRIANKRYEQGKFAEAVARNNKERTTAKLMQNMARPAAATQLMKKIEQNKKNNTSKTTAKKTSNTRNNVLNQLQKSNPLKVDAKSKLTKKKTPTKAPYRKASQKSSSAVKKDIKKTIQTNTLSKLKANQKTSTAKKRTQSKFQKSLSNLKKNLKKLFKW